MSLDSVAVALGAVFGIAPQLFAPSVSVAPDTGVSVAPDTGVSVVDLRREAEPDLAQARDVVLDDDRVRFLEEELHGVGQA